MIDDTPYREIEEVFAGLGMLAHAQKVNRVLCEAQQALAAALGDNRAAYDRGCRDARALCDGSCDIALARRQVGPDGAVPGNARECAELWEAEANRLRNVVEALKEQRRGI